MMRGRGFKKMEVRYIRVKAPKISLEKMEKKELETSWGHTGSTQEDSQLAGHSVILMPSRWRWVAIPRF